MEGVASENSDSESIGSWTFVENDESQNPAENAEVSVSVENAEISGHVKQANECIELGDISDATDKEEDTDGISIISESEGDNTHCRQCSGSEAGSTNSPLGRQQEDDSNKQNEAIPPPFQYNKALFHSLDQCLYNSHENLLASNYYEDIPSTSEPKLRTYVHKRNQHMSNVLNFILLGSVITAAGVALGHMWGVYDTEVDCNLQNTPSASKLLANLKKLKQENAVLRAKVLELTTKVETGVYNETRQKRSYIPIPRENKGKVIETVQYNDLQKLIEKYDNKKLDIEKQSDKMEEENLRRVIEKISGNYLNMQGKWKRNFRKTENTKDLKKEKKEKIEKPEKVHSGFHEPLKKERKLNIHTNFKLKEPTVYEELDITSSNIEKIHDDIKSYSAAVKNNKRNFGKATIPSDFSGADIIKKEKHTFERTNEHSKKRKSCDTQSSECTTSSDEEIEKDYRYVGKRIKPEKKEDRKKTYKKVKRENKYKQWEMKGGYQKDYDSVSLQSGEETENWKIPNRIKKQTHKSDRYDDDLAELAKVKSASSSKKKNCETKKPTDVSMKKNSTSFKEGNSLVMERDDKWRNTSLKDFEGVTFDWFGKRSAARRKARELRRWEDGARWYFRRMRDREQCRSDRRRNTTQRSQSRDNGKVRR